MAKSRPPECEEIADELFAIIRPFYKSLRMPGARPAFRKSLQSHEVEELLFSLHDLVVDIKESVVKE